MLAKVRTALALLLVCSPPPGEWLTRLGGTCLGGGVRVRCLFLCRGSAEVLGSVRESDLSLVGPGLGAVMRCLMGLPPLSRPSLRWSRLESPDLEEDDSFFWLSLSPSACLSSFPPPGEVGVFTRPGPVASPLACSH